MDDFLPLQISLIALFYSIHNLDIKIGLVDSKLAGHTEDRGGLLHNKF